jgi:uroporphyrinogen-III decarboxylase
MLNKEQKREEYLNIIRLNDYGLVPARVLINGEVWDKNPFLFEDLKNKCPHVMIMDEHNPEKKDEHLYEDDWGCVWHLPGKYLTGQVVEHPIESWEQLKNYEIPDPDKYRDWSKEEKRIEEEMEKNALLVGVVEHSFFYLKLIDLRGFKNFMLDIAKNSNKLKELSEMIFKYWENIVKRWLDLGVDLIYFGDDLGLQNSMAIKPSSWRKFIKPYYSKLFSICRQNEVEVYLHTDGYIMDIINDLIDIGVTVLNPQDLVNGINNLRKAAKGKLCIDLDIDRQKITSFGTPEEIDRHILNCVKALGSTKGGLMLLFGAYPGIPIQNVAQVIKSMEKYYDWWEK